MHASARPLMEKDSLLAEIDRQVQPCASKSTLDKNLQHHAGPANKQRVDTLHLDGKSFFLHLSFIPPIDFIKKTVCLNHIGET